MSAPNLFAVRTPDLHLVMNMLRLLARDPAPSFAVSFPHVGEPLPKARARFTKAGPVYTPKHVVQAEKDLAWVFKSAVLRRPWKGPIAVAAIFYRSSHRLVDGDNLMKLVLDAATKAGVWTDDSQVVAQACWLDYDAERPRSIIGLCPALSGLKR